MPGKLILGQLGARVSALVTPFAAGQGLNSSQTLGQGNTRASTDENPLITASAGVIGHIFLVIGNIGHVIGSNELLASYWPCVRLPAGSTASRAGKGQAR